MINYFYRPLFSVAAAGKKSKDGGLRPTAQADRKIHRPDGTTKSIKKKHVFI